jgi:hypothetical protein
MSSRRDSLLVAGAGSGNVQRMPAPIRRVLILLILLIPSAQFAWRNRTMPQFAYLHDDGVLFVTAKSAAEGSYRIESLPENPSQTKFPPLYPAYLSIVWRINSTFPDNLRIATLLSWLALAALLVLVSRYYLAIHLSEPRIWLMVGLLAVNPYLILFGCTMFSEVFFTCWVVAVFLAISKPGVKWAIVAGLLAGCAYLSRTAGLALLISVPAWLALKRDWRRAGAFAIAMLPALIGWMLWIRLHMVHPMDQTLMYYTDYTGYEFLNVGMSNLPIVLWKNLDQLLYGMGSLVLPKVFDILPVKILTQVIAIAMIAGVVRLARRGIMQEYAVFCLVSSGVLLVWHFPPNERFVLPMYPLLVAGLVTEIEHIATMLRAGLRHRDFGQRVVAGAMAAAVVIVFGAALVTQFYVTFVFLHESADQKAAKLADQSAAYAWMAANLPVDANVLSYDDTLLYLYAHRRGNYLPLLPRWWYAEDHAAMVAAYKDVAAYCRDRHLDYFYFTTQDLDREVGEEDRQAIEQAVRANRQLAPVFQYGIGTVYKVMPIGRM